MAKHVNPNVWVAELNKERNEYLMVSLPNDEGAIVRLVFGDPSLVITCYDRYNEPVRVTSPKELDAYAQTFKARS